MSEAAPCSYHNQRFSRLQTRIHDALHHKLELRVSGGTKMHAMTDFVRCKPSAENRSNNDRVDILRQDGEIICVQSDVLLETAVFMMQVIRTLNAVLLLAGEAELATSADATCKADADQITDLDVVGASFTLDHDPAYTLVTSDVRKFDLGNRIAVWAGGSARLGVEICRTS